METKENIEEKEEKKQSYDELYNLISMKYYKKAPDIKKNPHKEPFFSYFFKERPKIKKWNRETNLIKFKFFGFKMEPGREYKKILDALYIKHIYPVECLLPEILKNGWKGEVVTIKEYNLIVYFKDFCSKLHNIEKEKLLNFRSFKIMEESYLKLIYKKYFPEMLSEAIKKILTFLKNLNIKKELNTKSVILNLKLFFLENHYKPSFPDLILAMNMVHFNKFVEFNELIKYTYKDIIPLDFYKCSKDIFSHIVIYMENNLRLLKLAKNEKEYIDWLNLHTYLKKDKPPLKVKDYYESLGKNWEKDSDDVFLLLISLFEGIINDLNDIMHNEWQVMNEKETIIRTQIISAYDIDSYNKDLIKNYEVIKLRNNISVLKNIELDNFIKKDNVEQFLADKNHLFIFEKIQDIFLDLRSIARIFQNIYLKNQNKPDKYLNFMVVKSSVWRGKPVHDILIFYMELFLQICGYFKEKKLISELGKEEKVKNQIEYYNNKINWTGDSNNIILNELQRSMEAETGKHKNE